MIRKYDILAIVIFCCAISCVQKEEKSIEQVTFKAVLADSPTSKTVLQADGSVFWSPGDAINLFYGENGAAMLTSTNADAAAQTTFTGTLDGMLPNGADEFWAVYPYSEENIFDGSAVTLTLPDEQTGVAGTFANGLFFSLARSQDYSLQFYNLCGGIKFSVSQQGIQSVTFKGNDSEILAGQVQVTFNAEGKPVVSQVAKGASELRLNAPEGGFEVGQWYYIVSLPATLSAGYTMIFYSGPDVVAERISDTPVTIKRSVWGRLTEADAVEEPITASKYLTFSSDMTTTISLTNEGGNAPVLYYSTDAENWTQWDYSDLSFSPNAPLYLCGDNAQGFSFGSSQYSHFTASGDLFAISGDIMSLLNKDAELLTIPNEYCFYDLFYQCSLLSSGPSLTATALAPHCYENLFNGCESLYDAPELPATTLADWCYSQLFFGCSSINEAPALPVTTLAPYCYYGMFNGTGISAAPELPATSLEPHCYDMMFMGCEGLEECPELPATTLAEGCYESMFYGCSSLEAAPDLPAPTLVDYCYNAMFWACYNLNYVKCLATDIEADACTSGWLSDVAQQGIFVKAPNAQWPIGPSGVPQGWTIEDFSQAVSLDGRWEALRDNDDPNSTAAVALFEDNSLDLYIIAYGQHYSGTYSYEDGTIIYNITSGFQAYTDVSYNPDTGEMESSSWQAGNLDASTLRLEDGYEWYSINEEDFEPDLASFPFVIQDNGTANSSLLGIQDLVFTKVN